MFSFLKKTPASTESKSWLTRLTGSLDYDFQAVAIA